MTDRAGRSPCGPRPGLPGGNCTGRRSGPLVRCDTLHASFVPQAPTNRTVASLPDVGRRAVSRLGVGSFLPEVGRGTVRPAVAWVAGSERPRGAGATLRLARQPTAEGISAWQGAVLRRQGRHVAWVRGERPPATSSRAGPALAGEGTAPAHHRRGRPSRIPSPATGSTSLDVQVTVSASSISGACGSAGTRMPSRIGQVTRTSPEAGKPASSLLGSRAVTVRPSARSTATLRTVPM
jgi:hypothetical protein